MEFTPLAFMEFFIVLAFAIGWLILERVARRLDKDPSVPPPEETKKGEKTPSITSSKP